MTSLSAACSATYANGPDDGPDAAVDSAPGDDAPSDAAIDAADGGPTCTAKLDAPFTPAWKPARGQLDVCSKPQLQAAYKACFGSSAASFTCEEFEKANEPCAECLVTTYVHASYGPIVVIHNGTYEANISGCMALLDGNNTPSGCGAKYQALTSCEDTACGTCPLDTHAEFDQYVRCLDRADDTVCKSYRAGATCASDALYAPCFKTSFEDYILALGGLFCDRSDYPLGVDAGDASVPDGAGSDASESDANDASSADDAPADAGNGD